MSADAKPGEVARNVLGAVEFETLRSLRRVFARGGLPPMADRSPEDDARIATYRTLAELLRLLNTFRTRLAAGDPVRLVVREHPTTDDAMHVEIAIVGGAS